MSANDAELLWIAHGSALYREWVELRFQVLREPLGLSFSEEQLAAEADENHLVARSSYGRLIGGLILRALDSGEVKMRQVAVLPEFQGKGIGELLVREFEKTAEETGCNGIVLHSRETAIGFYEKLGYQAEGEAFTEVGLPHRLMRKYLS